MKAIHALLTLAVLAGIAATLAFAGPATKTTDSCCRTASCCPDKACCEAGKCCDTDQGCQAADCKTCGPAKTSCHEAAPAAGAGKSCCSK